GLLALLLLLADAVRSGAFAFSAALPGVEGAGISGRAGGVLTAGGGITGAGVAGGGVGAGVGSWAAGGGGTGAGAAGGGVGAGVGGVGSLGREMLGIVIAPVPDPLKRNR